jgi:phosphoglycolate phosphatase
VNILDFDLLMFDLDGTLVDSVEDITNAANFALNTALLPSVTNTNVANLIGLPVGQLFEKLEVPAEKLDPIIRDFRAHLMQFAGSPMQVYPAVVDFLRTVSTLNIHLALTTNKPSGLAETVLDRSDLREYFSSIFGSDKFSPKPSPEMILACISHYHVEPKRSLLIGDTMIDVAAAAAAGCESVLIEKSTDKAASIMKDYSFSHFESFEKLLAQI